MEGKKPRGFAAMSPERRREIAAKGGRSVLSENRTFARNADLASKAGQKGGTSVPPDKRPFAQNRELASLAGKKGGLNSHRVKRELVKEETA